MSYKHRILEVLNQSRKKDEIKWSFYKFREVKCGWELGFHVPSGSSFEEAEKLLPAIIATCGYDCELLPFKGLAVVRIIEKPMPTKIIFEKKMLDKLKPSEILIGFDTIGERVTFNWELPHGIVAAETGMGKTDFLRLLIYCLLHDKKPVDIRIIDMKMLSFLPFRKVSNITLGIGWNGALEMLTKAADEVTKRNMDVFNSGSRKMTKTFQKIVVIVDEAAEIAIKAATLPEEKIIAKVIERSIITIARMGREVGVHLIYCTQYPTVDLVSNQIRINCGMRLCFYVPEQTQSEVILQRKGAEDLNAIPGRAIFKSNKYSTVQVPYVGDDDKWERMLTQFKTEVINDGNSNRTETPRQYIEGSYTSADSANRSNSETVFKQQSGKESFRAAQQTGSRKDGRIYLAQTAQSMEGNKQIFEDDEWI